MLDLVLVLTPLLFRRRVHFAQKGARLRQQRRQTLMRILFFLSQTHTRFSDSSEQLSLRVKEKLLDKFGIPCYFDLDDLQSIDRSSITEGIRQACSVLLVLVSSPWIPHIVSLDVCRTTKLSRASGVSMRSSALVAWASQSYAFWILIARCLCRFHLVSHRPFF